ncbi:MAG: DUF4317 domain-containing protein [Lachnospiraceae bacterium]|nr:DUF4317 domain-containing protein [Lachnospiraceae bacterium]
MIKKEISEIKRQFTNEHCTITRLCGCYVDGEKRKMAEIKEAFLSLPEDEIFKYFEIFRKSLSGTLGKNLINMEFPKNLDFQGTSQAFLYQLRESRLTNPELLESFYDKVIETYDYVGNYLILLIHAAYDVPGKTSDGIEMNDASDEVYEYILCCICPVNLSKAGLSYDAETNTFRNRIRDWIVELPETGFLFPAFNDRSTDIYSLLYYAKNAEMLHDMFIHDFLGCTLPLSAGTQKETFHSLIADTLGPACEYEVVKNIHDKLNEMIEEHKDIPQPLLLEKEKVKTLFADSGVENSVLNQFDETYEKHFSHIPEPERPALIATNLTNSRTFEIKTPEVVIKVNPERTNLVDTRIIDGKRCIVIEITDEVSVNGISLSMQATPDQQDL